jgi:hypothetical protein
VTEPNENGVVVIVNVTTHSPDKDGTVILDEGDHPFMRHPSSVYYALARLSSWAMIQKAIGNGLVVLQEPMTDSLLDRVRQGGLKSPFTPGKIKSAIKVALGA